MDPEVNFAELFAHFDTAVMGRKTFATLAQTDSAMAGLNVVVYSKTVRSADYTDVTVVASDPLLVPYLAHTFRIAENLLAVRSNVLSKLE